MPKPHISLVNTYRKHLADTRPSKPVRVNPIGPASRAQRGRDVIDCRVIHSKIERPGNWVDLPHELPLCIHPCVQCAVFAPRTRVFSSNKTYFRACAKRGGRSADQKREGVKDLEVLEFKTIFVLYTNVSNLFSAPLCTHGALLVD